MKLLPQRKTLVGYARKIVKAQSRVQIEILQESYRERLLPEEQEVLDYLCGYRLLQNESVDALVQRAELVERAQLATILRSFVVRGARAQAEVQAIIRRHQQKQG